MHTPYRCRSHTKKQNSCKSKLPVAEKKRRSLLKKLAKVFPTWKYHFVNGQNISIYQYSFIKKQH